MNWRVVSFVSRNFHWIIIIRTNILRTVISRTIDLDTIIIGTNVSRTIIIKEIVSQDNYSQDNYFSSNVPWWIVPMKILQRTNSPFSISPKTIIIPSIGSHGTFIPANSLSRRQLAWEELSGWKFSTYN